MTLQILCGVAGIAMSSASSASQSAFTTAARSRNDTAFAAAFHPQRTHQSGAVVTS